MMTTPLQPRELPISDLRLTRSSCLRSSKRTTGLWKYHENLAPGVLCHVAESGEKLYTVRAGSPRLLSVQTHPPVCRAGRQILRRLSAVHQPQ